MEPLCLWPFPVLFPEHQNRLWTPIKAGCWGRTTGGRRHPARGQEHPPPAQDGCWTCGSITVRGISEQMHSFQHRRYLKAERIQDPTSCSDAICLSALLVHYRIQPGLGNGLSLCPMAWFHSWWDSSSPASSWPTSPTACLLPVAPWEGKSTFPDWISTPHECMRLMPTLQLENK